MAVTGSTSSEAVAIRVYGYVYKLRKLYNETNGTWGAFVVSTNSSFGVDNGQPSNYPLWCAFYDSLGRVGILSAQGRALIIMLILMLSGIFLQDAPVILWSQSPIQLILT